MSYYVCLGDIELDRVITVSQTGDREITVFDAVEAGKFPMPQHRSLKTWSIKFQTYDADIFDELDELHKGDDPVRLIINGEGKRISEKVYLKSYSMDEEYTGVYNGTVSVIEHTSAGVKTIAVPYAAREGTPPPAVMETTITPENEGTWAYDMKKTAETMNMKRAAKPMTGAGTNADKSELPMFYVKSGRPVSNPAAVKLGETVRTYVLTERNGERGFYDIDGKWKRNNFLVTMGETAKRWYDSLEDQINKAYEEVWG